MDLLLSPFLVTKDKAKSFVFISSNMQGKVKFTKLV